MTDLFRHCAAAIAACAGAHGGWKRLTRCARLRYAAPMDDTRLAAIRVERGTGGGDRAFGILNDEERPARGLEAFGDLFDESGCISQEILAIGDIFFII